MKLLHMQQDKIFNKKVQQLEFYPHFFLNKSGSKKQWSFTCLVTLTFLHLPNLNVMTLLSSLIRHSLQNDFKSDFILIAIILF